MSKGKSRRNAGKKPARRPRVKTVAEARARVAELEAKPVLVDEGRPVAGVLWVCAQAQHELRIRATVNLAAAHRQGLLEPGRIFGPIAAGTTS